MVYIYLPALGGDMHPPHDTLPSNDCDWEAFWVIVWEAGIIRGEANGGPTLGSPFWLKPRGFSFPTPPP